MVTKEQIILIQTAARKAGLRDGSNRGRYDLVLAQYRTGRHLPVRSCKELNNWQIDDFLAICESMGWRYPGKSETYCRDKAAESKDGHYASYAQKTAIDHIAGDLGLTGGIGRDCLNQFVLRMTRQRTDDINFVTRREAYNIIEALKAQVERHDERKYDNCKDIQSNHTEVIPNGQEVQNQPAPF
jgi:hypothetical protein